MTMLGDKAVALAQSLIRCESVTPRDAGAIEVLIHALKPARFVCEQLSFGEGDERIENLYARVGEGPPHLCFAGHTDVVRPGDVKLWRHPPFAANVLAGVLYGRGASDMKGAIACFVAAALDAARHRAIPRRALKPRSPRPINREQCLLGISPIRGARSQRACAAPSATPSRAGAASPWTRF